jgi:hypothetical protein
MKFLPKSSSRRPLRFSLIELHATGVIQVFRRHSLFRLWEPLREPVDRGNDFAG